MRLRLWSGMLAGCLACSTVIAEPFPTRDQNPMLAGFGVPLPLPAVLPDAGAIRASLVANWSNTANADATDDEQLLFDTESRELRLLLEYGFAERWAMRIEIPYRRLSGGTLDGFIDGWHDLFGLPEGARPALRQDEFRLAYRRNGRLLLDLSRPVSGLGDIAIEMGYQWWRTERSAAVLWLGIEAPTGDEERLLGSDTWDALLYLAGRQSLGSRTTLFWQLGASHPGSGGAFEEWQKSWVGSAMAALEYAVWRGLSLKVQLDAHTEMYRSSMEMLGPAVLATLGGEYWFPSGWRLDVGVSEDLDVGASPDVSLLFAVGKRF